MAETYSSATTFDPDGTRRQQTAGPGAVALPAPGVGLPPELVGLLQAKMAREQALQDQALTLEKWKAGMTTPARREVSGGPAGGGVLPAAPAMGRLAMAPPAAAAAPVNKGQPIFTKTVGGLGMVPGTIRLNQWEPGAAFAGYEADLGSGPANAGFSTAATQAQGANRGIAADEWEQFVKQSGADPRGANRR